MTNDEDEGLRPVRAVRMKISAEFANDPAKIVEHYVVEQERYRERVLRPVAIRQDEV